MASPTSARRSTPTPSASTACSPTAYPSRRTEQPCQEHLVRCWLSDHQLLYYGEILLHGSQVDFWTPIMRAARDDDVSPVEGTVDCLRELSEGAVELAQGKFQLVHRVEKELCW